MSQTCALSLESPENPVLMGPVVLNQVCHHVMISPVYNSDTSDGLNVLRYLLLDAIQIYQQLHVESHIGSDSYQK